jgi:hypothetical protein
MPAKPRVLVTGYNIRYPLGGQVAHNLNYLVGLQRLGCEVWYLEESGSWPSSCFNTTTREMTSDPSFGIAALKQLLRRFGIENNWVYVDEKRRYHNLSQPETIALCRSADLLLTVSSVTWLPEFLECRRRVYIDTDPGVTQFQMSAEKGPSMSGFASPHDHQFHYTVGLNIGQPGCPIPTWGIHWQPWFQPIALELFPYTYAPQAKYFTTVMNWAARKPMVFDGVEYGPKSQEFQRFIDLPQRMGPQFEIAVGGFHAPLDELRSNGWQLRSPLEVTRDWETYREFIGQSRGEFSAATNLVVKTRSGWFSDRSAVYLAMGKPVIAQDTQAKRLLPDGEGFLPFNHADEVAEAIEQVNADYEHHCRAARTLAEQFFDAGKLLRGLFNDVGLHPVA